ncbi:MAG: MaoC family dehydratase [Candidatus Excrementavichristensenella sp.]|jgi:3-hydroxybutyryl-CoA dehydratase
MDCWTCFLPGSVLADDDRGERMYFDDLELGMAIDIAPSVIEQEKMVEFARTYDNIPLHTDEEYAKTTPFGKLIAPGVMSFMSVWAKYLEVDFFGNELLAGKSTKIEWVKPVYAGDVLTGKATVTRLVKRNSKNGLVEITIEAWNQNGELVLTNVTEAIVKCKRKGSRS